MVNLILPVQPFSSVSIFSGSGSVEPKPLHDWYPGGSFSMYSAAVHSYILPKATSANKAKPRGFSYEAQQ